MAAARRLLERGGREAVTTRAVGAEAGVSEPTIYRYFGDKGGLLDAVAEHGFAECLRLKPEVPQDGDPVDDLRAGWDQHVDIGLAHPALYALMHGDPRPATEVPAAAAAFEVLHDRIHRIAEAGRLTVSEERAAQLVHAVGSGITFALIAMPPQARDRTLSWVAREALLAAITTDTPAAAEPGPQAAAVALRALLPRTSALTVTESALMADWLDRIAAAGPPT